MTGIENSKGSGINSAKEATKPALMSSCSSNDTPRLRGRRSQIFNREQKTALTSTTTSVSNLDPASWIRSASTPGVRQLKRTNTDSIFKSNRPVSPNSNTTTLNTNSTAASKSSISVSPSKAYTSKNSDNFLSPSRTTSETEILMTKIPISRPKMPSQWYSETSMQNFWEPTNSKLIDHTANLGPEDDFIHFNHDRVQNKNLSFMRNNINHSGNNDTDLIDTSNDVSDDLDEDVVVDVLPSFEMYNALHRHIPQGNVDPDIHELPPSYMEASNQSESMPNAYTRDMHVNTNGHSQNDTAAGFVSGSSMESTINNLRPLTTQVLSLNNNESASSFPSRASNNTYHDNETQIEDDLNVNDNIVIDKLYTLPKLSTPIEITIKITKHVSLPPYKPEEESILKEYTSGDTIHGYCVIENKSNEPIKFEMFYVTLEAYTSVIDKKKGTRTMKRFLRMVDLSASWSYTNIDIASGFRYKCRAKDFDDAILGLNNNRILEPGLKYKKFFVFKFPKQLLDTTCKQEHFSHCLLPPSLGIDKYRDNCKYSGIKVNHILGCGHLGTKGSPILTNDFSDGDLSINYTIDTRIVGKDHKTQKLNIMKEHEYNIRFIPFGFHSSLVGERNPEEQLKDLEGLIEERLKVLRNIFNRLKQDEPIKNADIHGTDLVGTIDDYSELDSDEILARKLDQLHIRNRLDYNDHTESPYEDIKKCERRDDIVESELRYRIKGKTSSKIGIFSSFLSNSSSSSSSSSTSLVSSSNKTDGKKNSKTVDQSNSKEKSSSHKHSDKTGMILVGAVIPLRPLPYHVPSLLHKTNIFENKSKYAQENWIKLTSLLTDEERTGLDKIKINLTCLQSNNSLDHDPPQVQSISTELIVITVKSENSIPIRLSSKLLLDSKKLNSVKAKFTKYMAQIKSDYEKFRKNKTKLNELYNRNRLQTDRELSLNFTSFIPNQLYSNVESLANLQVRIHEHSDIFKKQVEVNKLLKKTSSSGSSAQGWIKKEPFHYERDIEIPIQYTPNLTYTLVPSFESCLCGRFYCIRVNIKFHHIGSVSLDVPVVVKNFQA